MKKFAVTPELKKRLTYAIPLVILFYFANKLSCLVRLAPGEGIHKLVAALGDLSGLFSPPLPSFAPVDLLVGLGVAGAIFAASMSKRKEAKKFRQDVEYGSARWGTSADIKPFMDADPMNNMILTKTEGMMMGSRPKNPKYARNKNVLVIGGSGSGKKRLQPAMCKWAVAFCRPG